MPDIPASHRDLLDAPVAILATRASSGPPQITVVWFLAEGDSIAVSLNETRQKVANLRRDPECSMVLLDLANPYRYVELRGTAELEPDDDFAFAKKVGAKYEADLRAFDQPGEKRMILRLHPTRIRAVDMSGG